MKFLTIVFTAAIFISAIFTIRTKYENNARMHYIFKPLTTILIIAVAVIAGWANKDAYFYLIFIGLLFCLAGDIFLMLPGDRFIAGLASFLVAHLLFSVAFVAVNGKITWILLLFFVILAMAIYKILLPFLGKLNITVFIYVIAIMAMAWRANENGLAYLEMLSCGAAAIGSLFFLLSDTLLAFNKFRKKFKSAEFWVLSTYFAAIYFIAISTSRL
ncbi:MAG: lysoplasmalogenase [bacterium]